MDKIKITGNAFDREILVKRVIAVCIVSMLFLLTACQKSPSSSTVEDTLLKVLHGEMDYTDESGEIGSMNDFADMNQGMEYLFFDMNGDGESEAILKAFSGVFFIFHVTEAGDVVMTNSIGYSGGNPQLYITEDARMVFIDTSHMDRAVYETASLSKEGNSLDHYLCLYDNMTEEADKTVHSYCMQEDMNEETIIEIDQKTFNALYKENFEDAIYVEDGWNKL